MTDRNGTRDAWSVLDVLVTVYLSLLLFSAVQGSGPERMRCIGWCSLMLAVAVSTIVLVRRRSGNKHERLYAFAYRFIIYGSVQLSYFLLRFLLPTARSVSYDGELYHLDTMLFGQEPTLWLDQFVTPFRTEWFAFFYFSYFFLLGVHVLPMLFLSRRPRLFTEFAFALVGVFSVGHLLYFAVPGYGPYHYLAYSHTLPQGRFYDLVLGAVHTGGAMKDIFPSLHTAGPTTIAIFAYRHRDQSPFKWTWPIISFFAANIVVATLFLRWHYAIDVLAGLALAFTMTRIAAYVTSWEFAHRAELGLRQAWPNLLSPRPEPAPATISQPDAEPSPSTSPSR